MKTLLLSIVFSVSSIVAPSAHAYLPNAKLPVCLDGPAEMRIDNARVLKFKTTTRNQYLDRAFVEGKVIHAPSPQNDHDHFSIAIGPGSRDTIEIVYNKEFGLMPNVQPGDPIIVCGDYITATTASGGYKPSPDGAIIHWVHFNPGTRAGSARHEHGFIMIGTNLIGFDEAPLGDWNGQIIPAPQPGTGNNPDARKTKNYPTVDGRGAPVPPTRRQPLPDPRRNDNRGGRQQSPGSWRACSSISECAARNGN